MFSEACVHMTRVQPRSVHRWSLLERVRPYSEVRAKLAPLQTFRVTADRRQRGLQDPEQVDLNTMRKELVVVAGHE